jgi:hypothetical protein
LQSIKLNISSYLDNSLKFFFSLKPRERSNVKL